MMLDCFAALAMTLGVGGVLLPSVSPCLKGTSSPSLRGGVADEAIQELSARRWTVSLHS